MIIFPNNEDLIPSQSLPLQQIQINDGSSNFSDAYNAQLGGKGTNGTTTNTSGTTNGTNTNTNTNDINSTTNVDTSYMDNISNNDLSFLTALGKVESNNNYNASPNSSGYEGKYQFRYRKGDDGLKYATQLGYTRADIRSDPNKQEKLMGLALKNYDSQIKGRGVTVNNWTRWLRHNQGLGGMSAILKGRLTPIIRRNIRNQGVSGKTDSDLINNYTAKFKRRFN